MAQVEKTKENLKKCLCMKCPSYSMGCKIKNMPVNMMGMMGDLSKKKRFEGLFCAFGKSKCIKEKKGCLCLNCPVALENNLTEEYYCTE